MLCDNCGKNEATIKLTQVINGKKTEMMICEECGKKMGITEINFEMPIDLSNFLGDFISKQENEEMMPFDIPNATLKCNKCNMTYEEFLNTGKFGCEECYNAFGYKVDSLLKRIQGTDKYIGRKANHNENNKIQENKNVSRLEKLQQELKLAIKEERYEDAAKMRDEIKNIGGK